MTGFDMAMLPEDCVSEILALTTPADVCRSSLASYTFRSSADSDVVWERFLPRDYRNIVESSITPLKFCSKKELFFRLCNPILVDGGNKSFTLDKVSGKKSYILCARELSISLSTEPMYWSWTSIPESRFSEVAVLKTIRQLEIQATIRTEILSPNTRYGAYLIFKTSENAYGLDSIPIETSIQVKNHVFGNTVYLCHHGSNKQQMKRLFYGNRTEMLMQRVNKGDCRVPNEREDGWSEIELGEFSSGGGDEEVKVSLLEVKGNHFKGGLIIEGIELKPKI